MLPLTQFWARGQASRSRCLPNIRLLRAELRDASMTTNRISLMVVDNHEVVRTGLKAILEPEDDIDVVAEAGSAQVASRMADTFDPSVVLMDVRMEGMNGIEACRIIKNARLRAELNKSWYIRT